MELEERIGVELNDHEVVNTETPRMVGDLIFFKLQTTDQGICQTQRAFYLLRRVFVRPFSLQRAGERTGAFIERYRPWQPCPAHGAKVPEEVYAYAA